MIILTWILNQYLNLTKETKQRQKIGRWCRIGKLWRHCHFYNLWIYGQFGAIRNPDSGCTVCKLYIFINSNLLSYKNWKQNQNFSYTALTLLLWVKVLLWPKNADFLQKNAGISKIKKAWYSKVYFSKLHMCVYLRAKFQFSSITVTSFRQKCVCVCVCVWGGGGVNLNPPPHLKMDS